MLPDLSRVHLRAAIAMKDSRHLAAQLDLTCSGESRGLLRLSLPLRKTGSEVLREKR